MFWKHRNCACNVFLNATSGVLSPYTRSVKNLEQSDKRCWLNKSPVGSHLNPSSVSLYPDAHWHSVPRDSSWTQKCSQPPLSTSHFLAVTEKQNKTYFNVKNTVQSNLRKAMSGQTYFAVFSDKAWQTVTGVCAYLVLTCASVLTGWWFTLVPI